MKTSLHNGLLGYCLSSIILLSGGVAHAQMILYNDVLSTNFEDWSWANRNLSQNVFIHQGRTAISAELDAWSGLYFHAKSPISVAQYTALNFWINAGPIGGQRIRLCLTSNNSMAGCTELGTLPVGRWEMFSYELNRLGNIQTIDGLWLQDNSGRNQETLYFDDIVITPVTSAPISTPAPPPSGSTSPTSSSSSLDVYRDGLTNSFSDRSWARHSLTQTRVIHSGQSALSFEPDRWQGVYFYRTSALNLADFTHLEFWINGGDSGGQDLSVTFVRQTGAVATADLQDYAAHHDLVAPGWQRYQIPLNSVGLSSGTLNGFWIQDNTGGDSPTVYLDDIAFTAAGSSSSSSASTSSPPALTVIAANNSNMQFTGRFDTSDSTRARCAWSHCQIALRFNGSGITLLLRDNPSSDNTYLNVSIDNQSPIVLRLQNGTTRYPISQQFSSGSHDIRIVKRTEAMVGTFDFLGVEITQGGILPPPSRPSRRIENIGASLTAGYGIEGDNQYCSFSGETENSTLTYGALAASSLNAEYVNISWSGKGVTRNSDGNTSNTMPVIYSRTLPAQTNSSWNFSLWTPDVVVINLGNNDFSLGNPDVEDFVGTYERFIDQIRRNYPNAFIICAFGPMLQDEYPAGQYALSTTRDYMSTLIQRRKNRGDQRISQIEFPPQRAVNGYGCSWHPSRVTQQLMATQLTTAIRQQMGW